MNVSKIRSTKMIDEESIRQRWQIGSLVQIYSYTMKQWFFGKIVSILIEERDVEWLEVKYNNSSSKQARRNSHDIRPFHHNDTKNDNINKQIAELLTFGYIRLMIEKWLTNLIIPIEITVICFQYCFCNQHQKSLHREIKIRNKEWDKGDKIQICSGIDEQWYEGEVVDIFYSSNKDEKLEQLECVWTKPNGEVMSKLFSRFSNDVRAVQNHEPNAHGFCRGYYKPSNFMYPATNSVRRSRKLLDVEETAENDQYIDGSDVDSHRLSSIKDELLTDNYKKYLKDDVGNSIISTMSHLSLEFGKMFDSEKINTLCQCLEEQLLQHNNQM